MGSMKPRTIMAMASSSGEAAGHEVEELLLAHLRDRGLVAEVHVVDADVDPPEYVSGRRSCRPGASQRTVFAECARSRPPGPRRE